MPINAKQKLDHMINTDHPIKHFIESCQKETNVTNKPGLAVMMNSLALFLDVYDGEDSEVLRDIYNEMATDVVYIVATKCEKILYAYKDLTTDKNKLMSILKKLGTEDVTGVINDIIEDIESSEVFERAKLKDPPDGIISVIVDEMQRENVNAGDPLRDTINALMGEDVKKENHPYKSANDGVLEDPKHNDAIDNFLTERQFDQACSSRMKLANESEGTAKTYCNARIRQLQLQHLFGK